jgi:hypothetical protein
MRLLLSICDVYGDSWNPWRRDDEAEAIAQAHAVLDQWETSGGATPEEVEVWLQARRDYWRRTRAEEKAERDRRKTEYDAQREAERLELLELEAGLPFRQAALNRMADTKVSPAMDPGLRAREIARLERELREACQRTAALREAVGDLESVIDAHGYLPHERRHRSLGSFTTRRHVEVRELRARRDDLGQQIVAASTSHRQSLEAELQDVERELALWMAIPEPAAEEMCPECPKPVAWHAEAYNPAEASLGKGPCPAYPRHRADMERIWAMLSYVKPEVERKAVPPPDPRRDPRTKAQLLEEIDRLQVQLAQHDAAQGAGTDPRE